MLSGFCIHAKKPLKHPRILKCTAFRTGENCTHFCIPYHKCENHTVTFFEKREELCHQKRDMPLGSFSLNIFIFCCRHINKYTGSNRSARMMSIFQGTQNCKKKKKKTEKNDKKTGDYSSLTNSEKVIM